MDSSLLITLLICTHNGELTIEKCLEAIANQIHVPKSCFEVVIVDNASNDNTADIASKSIKNLQLNGRIIFEPKIGKVNAFLKGITEAKSDLISIIDDDNFIESEFIHHTLEVMNQFPIVGMVGSQNSIYCISQSIPQWFLWVKGRYACAQPMLTGIETELPNGGVVAKYGVVAGAGSTFRVQPLNECIKRGYKFFNDTQRGKQMSVTGEDLELCMLFQSLGYRFAYDPRIKLRHAIRPERLDIQYLKALSKSQGAGALGADPFMFTHKFSEGRWPISWTWQWQLLSKIKRYFILRCLALISKSLDEETRFRNWAFRIECIGTIQRILIERAKYNQHIHQVAAGKWTELRLH